MEIKTNLEDHKKIIQQDFKKKSGLMVDFPKPGFGNTNDGNTARRFFNDPQQTADITGKYCIASY